jgi:D-tyrosyl-tRNA(Tyr) deacylase
MRLAIQRVNRASVKINDNVVGRINPGLFVLVGIKKGDTEEDAKYLASKLLKLRVMPDLPVLVGEEGKMNRIAQNFLVVSQFTLHANTKGGNRPSFIEAEKPLKAKSLYEYFLKCLSKGDINLQTGNFGEYMHISAELDGPVTIMLDSKK